MLELSLAVLLAVLVVIVALVEFVVAVFGTRFPPNTTLIIVVLENQYKADNLQQDKKKPVAMPYQKSDEVLHAFISSGKRSARGSSMLNLHLLLRCAMGLRRHETGY